MFPQIVFQFANKKCSFTLFLSPPPQNESRQHSRTNKQKQVLGICVAFHSFNFNFKINNFIYKGQSKRDALEGNNPFSCPKWLH